MVEQRVGRQCWTLQALVNLLAFTMNEMGSP
jgi:hypothetical protein